MKYAHKNWRTIFEPCPDITAYELALDQKYVNASQIVGNWEASKMGEALRHRIVDDGPDRGRRLNVVYGEWVYEQTKDEGE